MHLQVGDCGLTTNQSIEYRPAHHIGGTHLWIKAMADLSQSDAGSHLLAQFSAFPSCVIMFSYHLTGLFPSSYHVVCLPSTLLNLKIVPKDDRCLLIG